MEKESTCTCDMHMYILVHMNHRISKMGCGHLHRDGRLLGRLR